MTVVEKTLMTGGGSHVEWESKPCRYRAGLDVEVRGQCSAPGLGIYMHQFLICLVCVCVCVSKPVPKGILTTMQGGWLFIASTCPTKRLALNTEVGGDLHPPTG